MPNIDGGHYFLTALFPIRNDLTPGHTGVQRSCVHMVRELLATLATAQQSPASVNSRFESPFSRCWRTHFARMFVIDDVAYNGRVPVNTLLSTARGDSLQTAQQIDHLPQPYLVFVVDFDALEDATPDRYLEGLWDIMREDLVGIFKNCVGFSAHTAADFASYVRKGQIETTMPFNDYWTVPPPLKTLSPLLLLALVALTAVAGGVAGFLLAGIPARIPCCISGIVAGGAAGLFLAFRWVMRRGAQALPVAPDSDLRSVLKGLYLQPRFTRFVIDNQGASPEALYAAFGAFIAAQRPDDRQSPTLAQGRVF